jgi:hypothetical protein
VAAKISTLVQFGDMANCTLKYGQFQEKLILLDICGTQKASSADCEHGFGLMNLIKSKSRNRQSRPLGDCDAHQVIHFSWMKYQPRCSK